MFKIKFKGKRVDREEWIEGFYITDGQEHGIIPDYSFSRSDNGEAMDFWYARVEPESVTQLVCPDKNGKPVYAGDDVKYTPRGQAKRHVQSYQCHVTEFRPPSYGYGLCGKNDFICDAFWPDEIELIESESGK